MYSKILVPLDGSKTAENVLPFARCFARSLQIPVELMAVVDIMEMARNISAVEGLFFNTLIDDETRRYCQLLKRSCQELSRRGGAMHGKQGKSS